jgi:hypothetical protein
MFPQKFHDLASNQFSLLDRYNKLMTQLRPVSVIDVKNPNKNNETLHKIGQEIEVLQRDWVAWNKDAKMMRDKMPIESPLPEHWEVHFIHELVKLSSEMTSMNINLTNLADSYNLTIERRDAQINFNLATRSFKFAIIAFVISLLLGAASIAFSVYSFVFPNLCVWG